MATPIFSSSLTQLLWFARIVEAGSFAEAARRAGTTTSAVSKALSRFESQHGVRLLHRTTHALSLTGEGERMLMLARGLLEEVNQVENALSGIENEGAVGRVRISVPSSFGRACIMPALPAFLADHPEISLELHFSDAMVDLASGGFDFVVRSGALEAWPGHSARKLFSFPWVACATPDYLRQHGEPCTPFDLSTHSQIGFWNLNKGRADAWRFNSPEDGKAVRWEPASRYLFDDGQAAWQMVRAGCGIGWAPSWLGASDFSSGAVVEILKAWRTERVNMWVLRLERRLTPRRTQTVIDFLTALLAPYESLV